MSQPCLTCKHDSRESDPERTPCPYCGEGYMYYEPVNTESLNNLSDDEEDGVMKKWVKNWIEKQRARRGFTVIIAKGGKP